MTEKIGEAGRKGREMQAQKTLVSRRSGKKERFWRDFFFLFLDKFSTSCVRKRNFVDDKNILERNEENRESLTCNLRYVALKS